MSEKAAATASDRRSGCSPARFFSRGPRDVRAAGWSRTRATKRMDAIAHRGPRDVRDGRRSMVG